MSRSFYQLTKDLWCFGLNCGFFVSWDIISVISSSESWIWMYVREQRGCRDLHAYSFQPDTCQMMNESWTKPEGGCDSQTVPLSDSHRVERLSTSICWAFSHSALCAPMTAIKSYFTYMKLQAEAANTSNLSTSFSQLSYNSTQTYTHYSECSQMFWTPLAGLGGRAEVIRREFHAITVEQYIQQVSVHPTDAQVFQQPRNSDMRENKPLL